jgi:hypothetical protein
MVRGPGQAGPDRADTMKRISIAPATAVIALVAVASLAGTTAYAAGQINGKTIKVHSIPANRVVKNSFAPASRVQASGLVKIPNNGKTVVVFKRAPLTWLATCTKTGTVNYITLSVKASGDAVFTGNTGTGQGVSSGGLVIDTASNNASESSGIQYTVLAANGVTYSGIFTIFLNYAGTGCGASVTAVG